MSAGGVSMAQYDVCVVGAGMIGSAAARHAAQMAPNLSVCLIGPSEPQNRADEAILGAYFDEGRLARQMYKHPAWATIAQRAARNYRQLERDSGIPFYTEVGCLAVMEKGSEYLKVQDKVAQELDINVQKLSRQEAQEKFPYIDYEESVDEAWFEETEAGYVNPRRLVEAEQKVARRHGCTILDDVVTAVARTTLPGRDIAAMELSTRKNGKILAKKVLLATGAFTAFQDLLPKGMAPDMQVSTETVILAQLSEEDQIYMKNMPSMMYNGVGHEVEGSRYLYTYILPPIKYPDGKVYLKIGHMDIKDAYKYLDNLADIHAHYRSPGVQRAIVLLEKIMNKLFPDFRPVSTVTDTCVTTRTCTRIVFLDHLHPQLAVAIGGNGTAAKSCDEVGRMAAQLVLNGHWSSDLPQHYFRFHSKPNPKPKL